MSGLESIFSVEAKSKFARTENQYVNIPKVEKKRKVEDEKPVKMSRKEQRRILEEKKQNEDKETNNTVGDIDNSSNASSADDSTRTVFAGNIPLTETIKSLTKLFSMKFGEVESIRLRSVPVAGTKVEEKGNASVMRKVCTNSRSFGDQKGSFNAYIVFKETRYASAALTDGNNMLLEGRHIRVDSIPPTLFDPKRSVFLGGLPRYVDEEEIRNHVAEVLPDGQDDIEGVRLIRDSDTLLGKGIGYMLFQSRECVIHALGLNDSVFRKRNIRVSSCAKRTKQTEARKQDQASASASASPSVSAGSVDSSETKDGVTVHTEESLAAPDRKRKDRTPSFNATNVMIWVYCTSTISAIQ